MDYESYLNLDELLDTTKPVSDATLETMFIVRLLYTSDAADEEDYVAIG